MILLIFAVTMLCLKLSYFGIAQIAVEGTKNITKEEVIKLSRIYKGNNIFYVNLKESKQGIASNPYVLNVSIKRKLPNTLVIDVIERQASFYNIVDNQYIIIDKNGIVLEKTDTIGDRNLTKLEGVDFKQAELGKEIPCDTKRKIEAIGKFTELIFNNKSEFQISLVDISDLTNLKAYCGNMYIKLGNSEELSEKLNKALNLLKNAGLKEEKGYIDVSFKGNPVFFIEK